MAIIYAETDTGQTGNPVTRCDSDPAGPANQGFQASVGGTPGTTGWSVSTGASATSEWDFSIQIIPASGVSWDAGTWTVRFNVSTANMNVTLVGVYICQADSGMNNKATIGSSTGLAISLGTTGVKSTTVSGSSATPAAGDMVYILLIFSNGAMTNSSTNIQMNQNIDSPFTAGAATKAFPPFSAPRRFQTRRFGTMR